MPTINREALEQPFASSLIRSRKGAFGKSFSYVEGTEYIRRLNEALEGVWSFEVVEHHVRDTEVVVLGKLTAAGICKMAFGGSSITVSREGEVISIADDLKAAATDSLKKAASLMGVGLSLYSSDQPTENTTSGNSRRDGNGSGRPRQGNGNGQENGNGQRQSATGTSNGNRLTQRQLSAIWSMGRSLGQNVEAIRERSVQVFNAQPEHLSKTDASSFIQELGGALSGTSS
jgi:Rad52/22 family double-strand break repair protein